MASLAGAPGRRSLVFCGSIDHARFARDWLRAKGVRVEAVHSGPDSADRDVTLAALGRGDLDAVCTVDLFNEGVDLPAIDRVVMLRPTESRVVFLQQLGRGLRRAADKERLQVVDFVGNHRIFLERLRLLLSFVERPAPLRGVLLDEREPELPPGCSLDVELEAKTRLLELLGPSGQNEVERAYRELRAIRGERPTIVELQHAGYRPGTLRKSHGSWFQFVGSEGDLDESQRRVLASAQEWLVELETTILAKCFKLVVLEALLEADALTAGLDVDELCRRSHSILGRTPDLFRDVEGVTELPDPRSPEPAAWRRYWMKNPIAAWTGTGKAKAASGWFRLDGDRFVPRFDVAPDDAPTLAAMTRELVDYRLALYRARTEAVGAQGDAFECRLITNGRDPILKLPSRSRRPDVPSGEVVVRLRDGRTWQFRFAKEFVNVARPAGNDRNQLPDLLRSWFGPAAGQRGTAFDVRFTPSPDGWWAEPVQAQGQVIKFPRGLVRAFPTLQAAAGAATSTTVEPPEAEAVRLPVSATSPELFAVRASGDSMDGGPKPIRDGDWLVFRFARGVGLGAVEGRVALVQTESEPGSGAFNYQIKRVVRDGTGWTLRSDNPARPSFPPGDREHDPDRAARRGRPRAAREPGARARVGPPGRRPRGRLRSVAPSRDRPRRRAPVPPRRRPRPVRGARSDRVVSDRTPPRRDAVRARPPRGRVVALRRRCTLARGGAAVGHSRARPRDLEGARRPRGVPTPSPGHARTSLGCRRPPVHAGRRRLLG